jgi:hypothetical protein
MYQLQTDASVRDSGLLLMCYILSFTETFFNEFIAYKRLFRFKNLKVFKEICKEKMIGNHRPGVTLIMMVIFF